MAHFDVPNRSGLIAAALMAPQPVATRPSGRRVATADEYDRYRDAPFLVAVTRGPDHVFTYVNRMWERVMRLGSSDVVGKRVRDVFPNASATTYAARQRAFREGRPSTGKAWHYRWTTNDGDEREADFNFIYQPFRDAAGRVDGLLLIATEANAEPA
jgi:PAS domain-containing protein